MYAIHRSLVLTSLMQHFNFETLLPLVNLDDSSHMIPSEHHSDEFGIANKHRA